MNPIPNGWQEAVIITMRKDGWVWRDIREYWLLLDDFYGHAAAKVMEVKEHTLAQS